MSLTDSLSRTDFWEFPVQGGMVLAVPGVEGLYLLNVSAAFIWDHLGSPPDRIASSLAERFHIPFDVARKDVAAALHQWSEAFSSVSNPLPPAPSQTTNQDTSLDYRLNGKRFRITLDSTELEAEIAPRLAKLRAPASEPEFTLRLTTGEDLIHLHCEAELIAAEPNVSAARAVLLQEIVRRVHGSPLWLSLLHAGACGNHSTCVIFPAASHSGKTTLAAVLMQRGLTFYADDSVALEKETLKVPAMPFGLAIREGSWPLLAERFPGFPDLPVTERFGQQIRFIYPVASLTSVPASAIVFTRYVPDATPSIRPLDTLETLVHLKESGFWVEHNRESIRTFLSWLESRPCYHMTYADVDAAAEFISSLLQGQQAPINSSRSA